MSGQILSVSEADFPAAIASGITLVDCWAPWCGPCLRLAPLLDELALEFGGRLRIVKINMEVCPDLAVQYGVLAVPTLMLFRDGRKLNHRTGTGNKAVIREFAETAFERSA